MWCLGWSWMPRQKSQGADVAVSRSWWTALCTLLTPAHPWSVWATICAYSSSGELGSVYRKLASLSETGRKRRATLTFSDYHLPLSEGLTVKVFWWHPGAAKVDNILPFPIMLSVSWVILQGTSDLVGKERRKLSCTPPIPVVQKTE